MKVDDQRTFLAHDIEVKQNFGERYEEIAFLLALTAVNPNKNMLGHLIRCAHYATNYIMHSQRHMAPT